MCGSFTIEKMKKMISVACVALLFQSVSAQEVPEFDTPQKMGQQMNSAGSDIMPIFADNRMYFARLGHGSNKGGSSAGMDIWYSDYNSGTETWSTASNAMGELNTKGHNAIVGVSSDGNTLYLLNQYLEGGKSSSGISYTTRNGDDWSEPQNLDIPGLEKPGAVYGFFMAKSGKELIVSYQGEDSKGLEDLYIAQKKEGLWSDLQSLGDNINTSGFEMSPFLSDDGRTLYFSSNGHKGGQGNADIYMSKRLGNSWTSWTDPVNLGPKINSPGFEAYFTKPENSKYYYFVKNNSTTGDDIYRVGVGEDEPVIEVKQKVVVSGLIFDEKTKEPLSLDMIIRDAKSEEDIAVITSSENGAYEVTLDKERNYTFNILVKGYHEHHDEVSTPTLEEDKNEMEYNMPMSKLEIGAKIDLGHIYFVVSTDSLRDISIPQVDKLEKILLENPDLKIRIEGHTDNSGLMESNQTLSEDRASKIKELLVERGIKKNRLKTEGFGASRPLEKNDTEEHRQQNRRVDFVIIK